MNLEVEREVQMDLDGKEGVGVTLLGRKKKRLR